MASLPAFHSFNPVAAACEHNGGGLENSQAEKADSIQSMAQQTPAQSGNHSELKKMPPTATLDQMTDSGYNKPMEVGKQLEEAVSGQPDWSGQSPVTSASPKPHENGAVISERSSEKTAGPTSTRLAQYDTEKHCEVALEHDEHFKDTMLLRSEHQNKAIAAGAAFARPGYASPALQNNNVLGFTSVKSTQAALRSSQTDHNNSFGGAGEMWVDKSRGSTSVKPAQTPQIKVINMNQAGELGRSQFISMGVVILLIALSVPVSISGISVIPFEGPYQAFLALLCNTLFSTAFILVLLVAFITVSATPLILENMDTKINTSISHSKLSDAFYVYVLGSGGHTTEMVSLIRISHKPNEKTHRRYLITVGDKYSHVQCQLLEDWIGMLLPDGSAGTSDISCVSRARSVHESIGSSILSVLRSGQQIANVLRVAPDSRAHKVWKDRFPDVIVTNGPGTGFVVALVVFIMKVFYIVPRDRLKIIFVETWARRHELSVTGRLFYKLKLANLFVVQSKELATAFDVPCIGNVNKIWAESPRNKAAVGSVVAADGGDEVFVSK